MKIRKTFTRIPYLLRGLLIYLPMDFMLMRYCIKHRANPAILVNTNPSFPYGGLICPKTTILKKFEKNKQLFDTYFQKTFLVKKTDSLSQKLKNINQLIKEEQINYPFILKPDESILGMGLFYIHDESELVHALPRIKENYILQEYVERPYELGVFFIKDPGQKIGKILSMVRRYTIKKTTEPELITSGREIICKDETKDITPAVERIFNAICDIEGFYLGRFDIRVEDRNLFLSKGEGFKILEVNVGAYSMNLQAFDHHYSLMQKYRFLSEQLRISFDIARKNIHLSKRKYKYFSGFITSFKILIFWGKFHLKHMFSFQNLFHKKH